jgi:hypothetical protein
LLGSRVNLPHGSDKPVLFELASLDDANGVNPEMQSMTISQCNIQEVPEIGANEAQSPVDEDRVLRRRAPHVRQTVVMRASAVQKTIDPDQSALDEVRRGEIWQYLEESQLGGPVSCWVKRIVYEWRRVHADDLVDAVE